MSSSSNSPEWVRSIVNSMQRRRGPLTDQRDWVVSEEWPSFSARFFLLSAGSDQVALKLGSNWPGDLAEYVADETERVRDLLSDLPSGKVVMPGVLGVSTDPPALALDYLSGEPLFEAVPDLDEARRAAVLSLCGQAIGAYHSSEEVPHDPEADRAARDELASAARRSGLSGRALSKIEPGLTRSRGYRFSPNDFLLVDREVLVLLDPPHVKKYDYVHRDLGSFFMELHRALLGERAPRSGDDLARLQRAQGDFLDGYRETGPDQLDTDQDRWAIDVFQIARISGVAQNRLRTGKISAAGRALSWAWWLRRGLRHRLTPVSGG